MIKQPLTPPHHRLYAIGDIHGRLDLLDRLLDKIRADMAACPALDKTIIFLGDYIDRGLDSRGVLDRLANLSIEGAQTCLLRGNHDDMLLRFLDGDNAVLAGWLQLGGASTLTSYGVNPFSAAGKPDILRKALAERIPAAHLAFLRATVFSVTFGGYTFVHAGLRPGVDEARQSNEDKMWIRGDFLFSSHRFDTIVVHGHTIKSTPEVQTNRIGIDTGAFASGHLTCLVLDGKDRSFLTT